ncbi:Hypothetical predicted protein [Cloeon dipterum]|uniref:Metalloendopeptidase n=1 Tax=Cloeon dipterum TaxID=197152 RepID=A0A8S1CMH5_9INSE|nr:Hypothetical predicted protein [Cloeon dipterum]
MADYHSKTCLRFVEYDGNQTDYISIQGGNTGCWSGVGRLGGKQTVNLQPPNCLRRFGVIIHELMHTVGFYHEQSRIDRNDYVTINWENVDITKFHNFLTMPNSYAYGVDYDYGSVMHYTEDSFSNNGNNTLTLSLLEYQ